MISFIYIVIEKVVVEVNRTSVAFVHFAEIEKLGTCSSIERM